MYVLVNVYVCTCVHACVYVCNTCNYARVIAYVFDVRYICKCVFVSVCIHEGMYATYVCIYVCVCLCTCM